MATITETTDAPSNTGTPYEIDFEDVFLGTIASSANNDWVRTQLDLGFGYYATLRGDGSATQIARNRLELKSETGEMISNNSGTTAIAAISPVEDSTFYFPHIGDKLPASSRSASANPAVISLPKI